jgi:hypothetical protein
MPDVRNMHFILGDRIENEIAQARYDDHSHVALVGFSALLWRVPQSPCTFN